ncbi:unnamed protein product [Linum tenue]|uniref:Uncharacterized protein n=1 Tax=Linum tenue TaxID=586396 RepID=A0AAV0ICG5_9ROSI|nr:unnamed protein product [Linum tenue]
MVLLHLKHRAPRDQLTWRINKKIHREAEARCHVASCNHDIMAKLGILMEDIKPLYEPYDMPELDTQSDLGPEDTHNNTSTPTAYSPLQKKTTRRFDNTRPAVRLRQPPHLIVSGDQRHWGEFVTKGVLFHVVGWIREFLNG